MSLYPNDGGQGNDMHAADPRDGRADPAPIAAREPSCPSSARRDAGPPRGAQRPVRPRPGGRQEGAHTMPSAGASARSDAFTGSRQAQPLHAIKTPHQPQRRYRSHTARPARRPWLADPRPATSCPASPMA